MGGQASYWAPTFPSCQHVRHHLAKGAETYPCSKPSGHRSSSTSAFAETPSCQCKTYGQAAFRQYLAVSAGAYLVKRAVRPAQQLDLRLLQVTLLPGGHAHGRAPAARDATAKPAQRQRGARLILSGHGKAGDVIGHQRLSLYCGVVPSAHLGTELVPCMSCAARWQRVGHGELQNRCGTSLFLQPSAQALHRCACCKIYIAACLRVNHVVQSKCQGIPAVWGPCSAAPCGVCY